MKYFSLLIFTLFFTISSFGQYKPKYYHEVTVYNDFDTRISNYAAHLIINTKQYITAGEMTPDGSDIRFSIDRCKFSSLSYWIEKGINTDSTHIWVRIPSIEASGNLKIHMFYGDSTAISLSSFNTTFPSRLITSGDMFLKGGSNYNGWIEVKAGHTIYVLDSNVLELMAGYIKIEGDINVIGKGYTAIKYPGNGPGGGGDSSIHNGGGGGGYGGQGGQGAYDTGQVPNKRGKTYGSRNSYSIETGSGGGSTLLPGGSGGGAVSLKGQNIIITGNILANGTQGVSTFHAAGGGGGGAGGGILISGDKVSISGNLLAAGGSGGFTPPSGIDDGGGGGGGRIKIFHGSLYSLIGSYNVDGGLKGTSGDIPAENGMPGTFFDTVKLFNQNTVGNQMVYYGDTTKVNNTVVICQGTSILLGGKLRTSAGTYYDSLTSFYGCDSIVTTILTINPTYAFNKQVIMCDGDSVMAGGAYQKNPGKYYDTLFTKNGCDSIMVTTLIVNPKYLINKLYSICQEDSIRLGNKYLKIAGIYFDSLKTVKGCDSIIKNTLTVNSKYNISNNYSICMGDSILLAGSYQKTAGMYTARLKTGNGCDSVVVSTLVVNPKYDNSNSYSICAGDSILLAGSYRKIAGVYTDNLKTVANCDSIIVNTLSVTNINIGVTQNANILTATETGAAYKWLDCNNAFSIIPNETNQNYTAQANGSYAVEITLNSCSDTSLCYAITGLGIKDIQADFKMLVYPNPASSELNIKIESVGNKNFKGILFNTLGQAVYEIENLNADRVYTIPTTGFNKGIYYLKIQSETTSVIHKVILK